MSIIISAVLCTYNRSDMLKGCLKSLYQQTFDKNSNEIIVVDNNSSDDTLQVVEAFMNQGNLRYFLENHQGLSHARNRGLEEASGQYVAYIDNDARAATNWLEVAANTFQFQFIRPELHCLGGQFTHFIPRQNPISSKMITRSGDLGIRRNIWEKGKH